MFCRARKYNEFLGVQIINNGKVIRHRAGDSDNGTFIDIGNPLEEEKELLSKSSVVANGVRVYKFEEQPGEIFNEDQVGENFVFNICPRYLKYPLDEADEFLSDTAFACYEKKVWWKFW